MFKKLLIAILVPSALFCQKATVRPASPVYMPLPVDSNSPVYWHDGQINMLASVGYVQRVTGSDQFNFWNEEFVQLDDYRHAPFWIEAGWMDEDGVLYAWYHHEPANLCANSHLTAPRIGALVSHDGGLNFTDLGIVLESGEAPNCNAKNGWFAGGHGDFSVIERDGYLYFLYTSYDGPADGQGIAMARMRLEDRLSPQGRVEKFAGGLWGEPGRGGAQTAIFAAEKTWEHADVTSLWGPSVHFNTGINSFVMLMSKTCCEPGWPQEGIYVSFNKDIANPEGWSKPVKILDDSEIGYKPGWYPQVVGSKFGETDTVAGKTARLYIHGVSRWEITFE